MPRSGLSWFRKGRRRIDQNTDSLCTWYTAYAAIIVQLILAQNRRRVSSSSSSSHDNLASGLTISRVTISRVCASTVPLSRPPSVLDLADEARATEAGSDHPPIRSTADSTATGARVVLLPRLLSDHNIRRWSVCQKDRSTRSAAFIEGSDV